MASEVTVLIVDDEKAVADAYTNALVDSYDVITTYSGERALEEFDDDVDVVLLDRRMPGMSGDEVLEEIQNRDVDCRVVMVTAVDPDVDIIGMDFDEYLVKPVTDEELVEAVERMLARNTHDENIQEIVTVATKLATIEAKLELEQLEQSEEYIDLRERFAELRNEVEMPDATDDMYLAAAGEKIRALLDETTTR